MERMKTWVPAAAIAVVIAGLIPGAVSARSGGGHGSAPSGGSAATHASAPRDVSTGLPTGKRMHKPMTMNAKSTKPAKRLTPEKVEAGSENVRR